MSSKYEGRNPLEFLREDEPYFIIRGQDRFALGAMGGYVEIVVREKLNVDEIGLDPELSAQLARLASGVQELAEKFADWQGRNADLVKTPD